ncbi:MAG: extracellular solute-binding protein [Lachnospiraceae bacterium]|nr:extracellular solute-binding protein [Lachnospiraceae bacterium]
MKKKHWIKGVLLAAACLMGLAGCGKEEVAEEDKYEYAATFREKKITTAKNGYISSQCKAGDKICFLENVYSDNYESFNVVIHSVDINTLEDQTEKVKGDLFDNQGWVQGLIVDKDGNVNFITANWDENSGQNTMKILEYKGGQITNTLDLSFITKDGGWINSDSIVKNGDIFYAAVEDKIYGFDIKGNIKTTENVGNYIYNIAANQDGEVVFQYWGGDGEKLGILGSDGKLKESFDASSSSGRSYVEGGKAFITGETSVKEVDIATGDTKVLWNWLDTDINDSDVLSIKRLDEGKYSVVSLEEDSEAQNVVVSAAELNYQLVTPENAKETIVYGCLDLDWNVKDEIRKFNKTSDKYRIKVKCYNELYDEYQKAEEMFKTDLAAGKQIDFYSLDGYAFNEYLKSKMLLNLNPLFEKDFNRDDFMGSVLDIYGKDGKLYGIPISFALDSVIVSEETAAGRTSWTLDDVMELRKQHPDITFMDGGSRDQAFYSMLYYSIGEFVNTEKATCDFENGTFKNLLEFAKTFPEEFNYDDYDNWTAIKEGDTLMEEVYLWSPNDIELYDTLLDHKSVLIGFPSSDGSGNRIRANTIYGISAKSKKSEAAWEFIKTFLDEEYQKNNMNGFPVHKAAFEEYLKSYMIDESDPEGYNSRGVSTYGNGHITIEMKGLTEKEANMIREAIDTATGQASYDQKLIEMISEEVEPFFKGQKSAEEIASVLQSRVSIYLQEKE